MLLLQSFKSTLAQQGVCLGTGGSVGPSPGHEEDECTIWSWIELFLSIFEMNVSIVGDQWKWSGAFCERFQAKRSQIRIANGTLSLRHNHNCRPIVFCVTFQATAVSSVPQCIAACMQCCAAKLFAGNNNGCVGQIEHQIFRYDHDPIYSDSIIMIFRSQEGQLQRPDCGPRGACRVSSLLLLVGTEFCYIAVIFDAPSCSDSDSVEPSNRAQTDINWIECRMNDDGNLQGKRRAKAEATRARFRVAHIALLAYRLSSIFNPLEPDILEA